MNTTFKTARIIVLSGLLLFALAGPLMAGPVWMEGTVTKAPWTDKYRHIGINDVTYTFVPKYAKIERLYKMPSGAWNYANIDLQRIGVGERVWIRAEGPKIYQLIVKD